MKVKIKMQMEYKGAFWAGTFAQVLSYGVDFLLLWVVVTRFHNLAGWSSYEIILLYAMKLFSYGMAGTFFFHACNTLPARVQSGNFDEALVLPIDPLLYEVLSNCTTAYVRHMGLSLVIFVISFVKLGISPTPLRLFMLVLFLIGGALLQSGFFMIFSAPNFWVVRGERILELFFFEVSNFVQYPITIYPIAIQAILTFVLPYAFINFYPAQYILGKNDFSVFHPVLQYLLPIAGSVIFIFGVRFWHWSLSRYQSTGS